VVFNTRIPKIHIFSLSESRFSKLMNVSSSLKFKFILSSKQARECGNTFFRLILRVFGSIMSKQVIVLYVFEAENNSIIVLRKKNGERKLRS
jgi:hypothetical protein